MRSKRSVRGRIVNGENPDWQPLIDLAPDVVDDFMWMFEVESEDGRRLQAYKHYWTRRYLHLDRSGTAFVFTPDDRYQPVDPQWLLDLVLQTASEIDPLSAEEVPPSALAAPPSGGTLAAIRRATGIDDLR